jgi:hypothetical protein
MGREEGEDARAGAAPQLWALRGLGAKVTGLDRLIRLNDALTDSWASAEFILELSKQADSLIQAAQTLTQIVHICELHDPDNRVARARIELLARAALAGFQDEAE